MNEHELELALEGRAAEEAAQTPEETGLEEAPAAVAETVSEQEPAQPDPVQEYLAKYDGDTEKALRAAAEAQSLIGRQGSELGAIRQEIQALRQQFEPQAPEGPQYVEVDDNLVSWAHEIAASENAAQGAEWALQHQPMLYDTIIQGWAAVDPVSANRFETVKALQAQQAQIYQQLQPVVAPVVRQQAQDQFTAAWVKVKNETPDLDAVTPQLLQVAEQNPELLVVLQNGTQEARERVIRSLYWQAKGMNVAPLEGAVQQAAVYAADGAAALRNQAAVATMTASAPATPVRGDTHLDEWRNEFRAAGVELGAYDKPSEEG